MTTTQSTDTQHHKQSRREQILQTLAKMLEATPGGRITTAQLAKHVGVSEAALYRHFPSKAKMFEALIEFIEETIFSRITIILREEDCPEKQLKLLLTMIATFCARNPGICRIMIGDAIVGEHERLQRRVDQLYERIEIQLKQILKKGEACELITTTISTNQCASMLATFIEGKIFQFVRSRFKRSPQDGWSQQLDQLLAGLVSTTTAVEVENRQG